MPIAAQKRVNVSVQPAGWDINVIDLAMKIISVKIVSNYAIVKMPEHAMHKTEHALVAQVGSVTPAIRNVNLECLGLIVRKNANAISIMPFTVMVSMAVVFVKRYGEVSVRNISATLKEHQDCAKVCMSWFGLAVLELQFTCFI